MLSFFQKVAKSRIIIVFTAVFFISFMGFLNLSMMTMDGTMSDCPFMSEMSVCNMTPFEHLSAWQRMFTTLPNQNNILNLLLASSIFSFCFIYFRHLFSPPKNTFSLTQKRLFENQYFPVNYLQEAFSNGILNPKTF